MRNYPGKFCTGLILTIRSIQTPTELVRATIRWALQNAEADVSGQCTASHIVLPCSSSCERVFSDEVGILQLSSHCGTNNIFIFIVRDIFICWWNVLLRSTIWQRFFKLNYVYFRNLEHSFRSVCRPNIFSLWTSWTASCALWVAEV